MHDADIIILNPSGIDISGFIEIEHPRSGDITLNDLHVVIAIRSGLLVVDAQRMSQFVNHHLSLKR